MKSFSRLGFGLVLLSIVCAATELHAAATYHGTFELDTSRAVLEAGRCNKKTERPNQSALLSEAERTAVEQLLKDPAVRDKYVDRFFKRVKYVEFILHFPQQINELEGSAFFVLLRGENPQDYQLAIAPWKQSFLHSVYYGTDEFRSMHFQSHSGLESRNAYEGYLMSVPSRLLDTVFHLNFFRNPRMSRYTLEVPEDSDGPLLKSSKDYDYRGRYDAEKNLLHLEIDIPTPIAEYREQGIRCEFLLREIALISVDPDEVEK